MNNAAKAKEALYVEVTHFKEDGSKDYTMEYCIYPEDGYCYIQRLNTYSRCEKEGPFKTKEDAIAYLENPDQFKQIELYVKNSNS